MIDELLNRVPDVFAERVAQINSRFLEMIAARIGKIGSVSPTDFHSLTRLRAFGADYEEMIRTLARFSEKGAGEVRLLVEAAARDAYAGLERLAVMKGQPVIPFAENAALQRFVAAVAEQTAGSFVNLSNTSVVGYAVRDGAGNVAFRGLGAAYQDAVDEAIQTVTMGVTDFPSAMRRTMRGLADSGLRTVDYASGRVRRLVPESHDSGISPSPGRVRRLDSAVRMNISDGTRAVYQGVQDQIGREIGADGVEISAHGGCAADHLPYQGRQFSLKAFEALQEGLERPLGMWNCRHMRHAVLLGISQPAYSDSELAALRARSEEKILFEGRGMTRYEASQAQRRIEAAVRQSKDRANMAKAAGDDALRRAEQLRINQLTQKYKELSDAAELPTKAERMSVSGFRSVRPPLPKVTKAADTVLQAAVPFEYIDYLGNVRDGIIPLGAKLEKVTVIAGRGTSTLLRAAEDLSKKYGGEKDDWEKVAGTILTDYFSYEVHWYQIGLYQYGHKTKRAKLK